MYEMLQINIVGEFSLGNRHGLKDQTFQNGDGSEWQKQREGLLHSHRGQLASLSLGYQKQKCNRMYFLPLKPLQYFRLCDFLGAIMFANVKISSSGSISV